MVKVADWCGSARYWLESQYGGPYATRTILTRRIRCGIVYVMNTKLTLRMDDALVQTAKKEATRRGKSVSQMVGEFFDALTSRRQENSAIPPITASLVGVLKGRNVSESDYRRHLREKHS